MLRRRLGLVAKVALVAIGSLQACGGDEVVVVIPPFTVTPSGGTFSDPANVVTLTFPAGAVDSNLVISITQSTGHPTPPTLLTGSAFTFEPSPYTFNDTVTVRVSYGGLTLPAGVAESELGIHQVVGGAWVKQPGVVVDDGTNTITARTIGFSTYGVLGDPVAAMVVSPSALNVTVGDSVQLAVTLTDADGDTLAQRGGGISYATAAATVATVNAFGWVRGVSTGTTSLTVSHTEGPSRQVAVTVTAGGGGGTPGVWYEENFATYSSTTNLRTACTRFLSCVEDLGTNSITLDQTVGFPPLTQSMRYDWVNQGCSSISVGRGISPPAPVTEIWVEIYLRTSTNFTAANPACPPAAHKLIFGQVTPDLNGRWAFMWGMHSAPFQFSLEQPEPGGGGPWNVNYPPSWNPWDGNWHQFRFHWKFSSTTASNDGVWQLWVDGIKTYENLRLNVSVPNGRIAAILIGRNKDKGLNSGTESLWVGRVRMYNSNPGW